jgi:hypothetical protein
MVRDYKKELAMLEAMSPEERKVHFLQDAVDSELYWLDETITEHRPDRLYGQKGDMAKIREQRKVVQKWQAKLNAAKAKLGKKD